MSEIILYRIGRNGYFVGEESFYSDAEVSVEEILVPKWFVATPPPELKEGQKALWRNKQWNIVDPPPPPTLEEAKAQKKANIAESRWMEEISGLVLPNGMEIATDNRSQMKMLSIYAKAQADKAYSVRFKTPKEWVTLDSVDILSLQSYVFEHIENLFKKEEQKCLEVDACKTIEEVEAISWDEDISGIDSKE